MNHQQQIDNCPNKSNHSNAPKGYLEWHAWAEEKSKTHYQQLCPDCALWVIWVPKESTQEEVMPKTK